MKYKYLSAVLIILSPVLARAYDAPSLTYHDAAATNKTYMIPHLPRYGGQGRKGTISGSYELSYIHATSKINGVTGSGSGFGFKIEYAYKRLMPTNSDGKYNFFSIGLFYTNYYSQVDYKAAGSDAKTKYTNGMIGMPIAYCSISNRENTGYFWQVGVNLGVPGIRPDNNNAIRSFGKFSAEPCLYFGPSFWVERKKGVGVILLGPYVSYGAINVAKQGDATLNFLSAGIKYTGVLL